MPSTSFSIYHGETEINLSSDSTGVFAGMIYNTSFQNIDLALIRRIEILPLGWTSSICVGPTCYNEIIDSVSFNIQTADSIEFSLIPWHDNQGEGIIQIDVFDLAIPSENIIIDVVFISNSTNTEETKLGIETRYSLSDNFPNPFNSTTSISYYLYVDSKVQMSIYDVLGNQIITLVDDFEDQGNKLVFWNGKDDNGIDLVSGSYIYTLNINGHLQSSKMTLLK